jgi:imidazolonepropionase-like amidohydrolase
VSDFTVRNAHVLDESGVFGGGLVDVHVREGIVAAVGPNLPRGGESLDLDGRWLMPGVVDCHAHVGITSIDTMENLRTPLSRRALDTARNAKTTLDAGVTLVRDPGGADAGIRDAIAGGVIPGPTLQISIVLISQTGGHGDGFLAGLGADLSPEYIVPDYPGRPPYLADGPEDMRRVVRSVLRAGADWIKLCTTGGVLSEHDDPRCAELTREEIDVAVFEAARKGKGVLVHANGGEGLDNAVAAGARSVEHGVFLTEEQAQAMAAAGCWLVPTLSVIRDVVALAEAGALPPATAAKALDLGDGFGEAVRIARDAGVRIALGTDALSADMHGRNLRELTLMHEAGMPLTEVLIAATAGGAELCGLGATHGRIAEGYVFDAIVLGRDPSDPAVFADPATVTTVFKRGTVVRG